MDRSVPGVCAALLVMLVTGPAAIAQSAGRSLQIGLSGAEHAYRCEGDGVDSVQVTGNGDILTITGHCGSLQVTGNGNRITIDAVKSVQFTGDSNSVSYRRGASPSLSDQGQSNLLARAAVEQARSRAAAPGGSGASGDTVVATDASGTTTTVSGGVGSAVTSALQAANAARASAGVAGGAVEATQTTGNTLNLALSHQRTTQDCGQGKDVNINGDQNDIHLTGICGTVSVLGSGNTVHVVEVGSISVVGHTNKLTWEHSRSGQHPAVQIAGGADNVVMQAVSVR